MWESGVEVNWDLPVCFSVILFLSRGMGNDVVIAPVARK
jgi:hypothetical protein